MADSWFATERVIAPPVIKLLRSESRSVTVSFANALISGEAISAPTIIATLLDWRTGLELPAEMQDALVGQPGYNSTTKVISQRIDASLLPLRTNLVLRFTATVTFPGGSEIRAVYAVVYVEI